MEFEEKIGIKEKKSHIHLTIFLEIARNLKYLKCFQKKLEFKWEEGRQEVKTKKNI